MFDGRWRDAVDRSTGPVGSALHRRGITADVLTATGLVSATATAAAAATVMPAFAMVEKNRSTGSRETDSRPAADRKT